MTVVTAVVLTEVVAAVEAQEASAEAVVVAQRARPIVAVSPLVVDSRTVAIARSGQKDAVAVGAGYALTINAVKSGPSPSAVV